MTGVQTCALPISRAQAAVQEAERSAHGAITDAEREQLTRLLQRLAYAD